ncbi:MAG: cysteine--tRNA ligase [Candidatus Omnitrophica bacterium]|nr:cysteine--tRNA ligase [Candidatus Omnitrophota bacterium]
MAIQIYNSLTRKKEELVPLNPPALKIYTCGVTVYDESHIGHARSLYIFDVIRRYLLYRGFVVTFVRNITDIDDKIINRANELKVDWIELVAKYIARYYEDLESLGIGKADSEPRATENIPEMIRYIGALIEKGYAYESGGDVYFAVRKFADYGKLSGQSIDAMETGVRKDSSENKDDPLDFALWKNSKEGEPFWDSPWGKGRPGWHIECSVMSQKFLKVETLDIHAGGRDLIFPHHENEVAQAQALTGKLFAKYWIHHGLLTINSQKMSKSLGNFVTIKDFMTKYKNADLLKLFFLSAHYSSPIDYNAEKIEEAKKACERIDILMRKLEREFGTRNIEQVVTGGTGEFRQFRDKFLEYMDDDFNTPRALSVLFDLVNACNKELEKVDFNRLQLHYAMDIIEEMVEILGLSFFNRVLDEITDAKVTVAIALREQLKKEKKYSEADKIRRDLEEQGVILEDNKEGKTTWRRKI